MFSRGSRFPSVKPSEVPGPGHYNIQELDDKYKHGAFLEKTDRFDKEKESDVPGPGAYSTGDRPKSRAQKSAPTSINDRYNVLQKKLEDLERVHMEGKKEHRAEQDRLKRELSTAQRSNAEHSEHLAKSKQQLEAYEARIRDLNKAKSTVDAEVKELRTKLRVSEHARVQLVSKEGELDEAKKVAATMDAKRKDEGRDKDRRIAELEKSLRTEQRRREAAESRVAELQGAADTVVKKITADKDELAKQLESAEAESVRARHELEETKDSESALLDQLEAFKTMLGTAAEQYGRLASMTVSVTEHARLKTEQAALQIRQARLERKLANSEDQVQELAHLIRQTKEHGHLLSYQLRDAEAHACLASRSLKEVIRDSAVLPTFDTPSALYAIGESLHRDRTAERDLELELMTASGELWRRQAQDLLQAYLSADHALIKLEANIQARDTALSEAVATRNTLSSELDALRTELNETQRLRAKAEAAAQEAQTAKANATQEVEDMKQIQLKRESANEVALQKEKEAARRSAAALQKSKLAEEALQSEIEQLTAELMDAIKYQTAYDELTEQVADAIARSALAEEEAEKLSKFNAEILGHQNSSQKIMYVDRIRRELADTKQQLLAATREIDAVFNDNQDLRYELDMYKAVADDRPRTGFTRVTRAPLAAQSINAKSTNATSRALSSKSNFENFQEVEVRPGDLTLDELK